jgi:YggT family protein
MNLVSNVTVFLLQTAFSLYIGAVVLRFLLASVQADFYNPLSQFLITITNPLLKPLRRIVPSLGPVDTASVVLALGLKTLELWLLGLLAGLRFAPWALLVVAVVQLLELVVYIYVFSIIIQAVLSWVSPGSQHYGNPIASLLYSLNEPLLRPLRQIIPRVGMIDLSPLVAIIGLNVVLIVLKSLV